MNAAFHFDVGNDRFGNPYGERVENLVFSTLLKRPVLSVFSKVYVGDLLLSLACSDEDCFRNAVANWIASAQNGWNKLNKRAELLFQSDVYIVCFDAIDKTVANLLHERLLTNSSYITAIEINDADEFHWQFYSDALSLRCRLSGKAISVLNDAFEEPLTDGEKEGIHSRFSEIGFPVLGFAFSEGKHSIFDKYPNFEQARRIAEWRDKFGEMLGFVADNVITRLSDLAPKLGDRLWAAYQTFVRSETNEELAQVCVSCRRIIHYVADTLFPACETQTDEKKLGPGNYRNRLMAFAEKESKSGTNLDVICSSLDMLEAHLQKLDQLANKGIHDEVTKEGTRRCLLRTVMLLDDIASLRSNYFQIKTELDFSILEPTDESKSAN